MDKDDLIIITTILTMRRWWRGKLNLKKKLNDLDSKKKKKNINYRT